MVTASSPWAAQSDELRALRALVRGRDEMITTPVRMANQLRALLESFWPGAAEVFTKVDLELQGPDLSSMNGVASVGA